MGVIGKDLAGLGAQAEALTGKLNLAKVAALGAVTAIAGIGILTGMGKLVEHGQELVHQQVMFKDALKDSGLTAQQIALETQKVTAAAWQNTRDVQGTTVAENLQNIRELRMVYGQAGKDDVAATKDAIANLADVTKARMILHSLLPDSNADKEVFNLAKSLEIKGVSQNPEEFRKYLDDFVKIEIASGGKVTASQLLGTFKYGRTATLGWGEEFVSGIMPTLVQEMSASGGGGGGGPGNALQSMFQAVVGGTMSNKAANEFVKFGLVDPNKIIWTKSGHVKGIEPGGVKGAAEFADNPYQWVQDVLVPALKAHGINMNDRAQVLEEISHMFTNRTAQQIAVMFATQQQRFEKDEKLFKQSGGLSVYDENRANDPVAKMQAFTAAWQNLLTALGAPMVDFAYKQLDKLTNLLANIADWASKNPETVGAIEKVVAAIGVGAVVLGGATFIGAILAMATPIGAAIAAFTALGTAAFLFRDKIKEVIDAVTGWLGNLVGKIEALLGIGPASSTPAPLSAHNQGVAAAPPINALAPTYESPAERMMRKLQEQAQPVPAPTPATPAMPAPTMPMLHPGQTLNLAPPEPPAPPTLAIAPPAPPPAPTSSGPVPVVVTNPHDIARGAVSHLERQLNKTPAGRPAPDTRTSPLFPSDAPALGAIF